MKKKEWNEGLNWLDPALIEQYVLQRGRLRSKAVWLRSIVIAACFALIVSTVALLPGLLDGYGMMIRHSPVYLDATISPEKISGSDREFLLGSSSGSGVSGSPPSFEFDVEQIVVKAKLVEIYPDVYVKLDTPSEYRTVEQRLLLMETLEVIHGENVPQYFLYLMSDSLCVELSRYDSFVISMSQLGTENYVLKNMTQAQMEALSYPVFFDREGSPVLGNFIAFRDGIFDESLWQNESWIYGYQFAKYILDSPEYTFYVLKRGDTQIDVINEIKKRIADCQDWHLYKLPKVITTDFVSETAREVIDFVAPFKNGVFAQEYGPYYGNGLLIYTRFINGCQTDETITIDLLTEEVTFSDVRYTQEELARIENISYYLSEKAKEYAEKLPTSPHINAKGKELVFLNLYGWYAKSDGKIYGVLKTVFRYIDNEDYKNRYYDDIYILYDMSESNARYISREELVRIVGWRNVYKGEYGEPDLVIQ